MAKDASITDAVDSFERLLNDAKEALRSQGQHSYLSQLLHQQRDRDRIEGLRDGIDQAVDALMLQLRLRANGMATALSTQLEDILAKHLTHIPPTTVLSPNSATANSLPPNPQLHFGRDTELRTVIRTLNDASATARIAILGGPGMGKTTLAVAALHDPSVERHFGRRRYFVACDAAEGLPDPFRLVSEALGEVASNQQQLRKLLGHKRTLLILDNFESAWEAPEQRESAESFLQFLGSIETLSLVVTMRGAERPQRIQWTQPFLPPLSALSDNAAKQTFLSIADCSESDPALSPLLGHVNNVPLALVLLANLAQYEPLPMLLLRWHKLETAMLIRGDGHTRLTSLDVSIRLSLRSPRIETDERAVNLLSLLSLLPCGAVDADIGLWGVSNSTRAISVLLRTSLASPVGNRIHILAPIRSFMLSYYPPSDEALIATYKHFFSLAHIAYQATQTKYDPGVYASIAPELANIDAVVRHALAHSPGALESAVEAVSLLCTFHLMTRVGPGLDLLPLALKTARTEHFDKPLADLLRSRAVYALERALPGDPASFYREARDIYQRIGDIRSLTAAGVGLMRSLAPWDAVVEGRKLHQLAEERQDVESMGSCLFEIGLALYRDGRPADALADHEHSIAIFESITAPRAPKVSRMIAANKYHIAECLNAMSNPTAAIAAYHDALAGYKAIEYPYGIRDVYMQLADTTLSLGRAREAIEYASCSLTVEHVQTSANNIRALLVLAHAHGLVGDSDPATAAIERLHAFEPEGGFSAYEKGRILVTTGTLASLSGDLLQARSLLRAGQAVARQSDPVQGAYFMQLIEASALTWLAEVELAARDRALASQLTITSATIFRALGASENTAMALLVLAEAGDDEAAEQLLRAIVPALHRAQLAPELARALLHQATIAQRRGEWDLAARLARKAVEYFGDIKDERRLVIARDIIQQHR